MSNELFVEWLHSELNKRGWSYAELSRRAGIHSSTISLVVNDQSRPGTEFCLSVASAFNLPAENVFRRAGILPEEPAQTASLRQIVHLFAQLPDDRQDTVLKMVHALVDEEERPNRARP